MSLKKFLDLIDRSPVGRVVERRAQLLEKTDPDRIFMENIRSFFHLPVSMAQFLCNQAVREGVFIRRIGYLCPNDDRHKLIFSIDDGEEVPERVICEVCQMRERFPSEFKVDTLPKFEFYKIND